MKKNQTKRKGAGLARLRDRLPPLMKDCHPDCTAIIGKNEICLVNSYHIHSRKKRLEICRLIAESGLTKRTPESLSAEWFFHNAAYVLHIRRSSSKDADLDYTADARASVRLFSKICEVLHLY